MPRFASLATAALAAVGLSSCFSLPEPTFRPVREERFVRIDAARDRVEWIEIQHGLARATGELDDQLALILARRRIFPASGGWPSIDYDEPARSVCVPSEELDPALQQMLGALQVSDVRLVLDADGCIALWRAGALERASEWLPPLPSSEVGNDWSQLLQGLALLWVAVPGDSWDEVGGAVLDARSLELLASAEAAGERPWSLRGNALCLDVPMTEASASSFLSAPCGGDSGNSFDLRLEAWLRELDTSNERLRARFAPEDGGWMRVAWTYEDRLDDSVLSEEQAREMGFAVDSTEDYARLRREHGLPALNSIEGRN